MLAVLLCGTIVYAFDGMAVIETYTGETTVTLYVKGIEEDITDMTVQVGTERCESVTKGRLAEKKYPIRTLIMLDNSLSIPDKSHGQIAEILQNIISDRAENEEIALATFDEDIVYLTDYTSDYTTLKAAVDTVAYQDLETYLTDVLYDLLSTEYIPSEEDVYRRIVVISDGVDNKSIGYTKEELYALLKEYPIPIYTIGMQTGKNNEELENMFAISRASNADSFLLEDVENLLDISTVLNADRNIIKLKISPVSEQMDGSKKMVKIVLPSGTSLSTEAVMPQQESVKTETEKSMDEEIQIEEDGDEELIVEERVNEENNTNVRMMIIIIIAVCFAIVLAVIVTVMIIIVKKKKQDDFEPITDDVLNHLNEMKPLDDSKTELMGLTRPSDDDSTFMIWNTGTSYDIVLTDIHSPARTFQMPLRSSVVIGRKQGMCDIAIDYDKSVSGRHCEIRARDGRFYITDLQSSNHTYVNDCIVLSEIEIFSGNILKLGRAELKFEVR